MNFNFGLRKNEIFILMHSGNHEPIELMFYHEKISSKCLFE